MSVTDTGPAAQARQLRIQQAMTGEQRLRLAFDMSEFARELTKQGIRDQHPEWPEAHVVQELVRLVFLPKPSPLPR
jgi:hypothetical protein